MKKLFKLKKFYISLAIFFGIIFLFLINFNREYKSQTDILVIFKSEKAVQNSDQILENFKLISQSLPFYEKVIASEPDVQDEFMEELPSYKRKQHWNQIVEMKRLGKSSVLEVSAIDKDAYTAQIINTQTVKSFIGVIGVFYDIENDIDIRIINPATTQLAFSGSYISLLFESLFLGFFLAVISNYLLISILVEKKAIISNKTPLWSYKETKEKTPKIKAEKGDKNKFTFKTETSSHISSAKKSSAPENLPFADDIDLNFSQNPKEEKQDQEKNQETLLTHEATPEEVKERLNKLLSGKM